jgi:hypothetical protein
LKNKEQIKQLTQLFLKLENVLVKKRKDYSNEDEDVLSAFKIIANVSRELSIDVTTPTGVALFMVILKIHRITNLLNNNTPPENESLIDSFEDGINYFILSKMIYGDKESKNS